LFLRVYSAWLGVQSALIFKAEQVLRISSSLLLEEVTETALQLLISEMDPHAPVPLRELCLVCFAAGAGPLYICFNGNFQLKTMAASVELRDGLVYRDTRDNRLFVPPNEEFISLEKTKSKTK
jgi:hypothetical protein